MNASYPKHTTEESKSKGVHVFNLNMEYGWNRWHRWTIKGWKLDERSLLPNFISQTSPNDHNWYQFKMDKSRCSYSKIITRLCRPPKEMNGS